MISQSIDLVMLALGCQGSSPQLGDGVHLRWQVAQALGYPPYGFDVLRRPHRPGSGERSIAVLGSTAGRIRLGGVYRSLTVRCSAAAGWVAARFAGGEMLRVAVSGNAAVVQLAADAMDELELSSGLRLTDVQGTSVQDEAELDWGAPLNGPVKLGFPLTDAAYPCRHARAPDDWTEARARLLWPGLPTAQAAALEARFGGLAFQQLGGVLRSVSAGGVSPILNLPAGQANPRIALQPQDLLALAATDADLARMLGLLWIDSTAPAGVRFDYRIVGYWSPGVTTITRRCTQVPATPGTPVTPGVVIQVPMHAKVAAGSTSGNANNGIAGLRTHALARNADGTAGVLPHALRLTVEGAPTGQIVAADSPWGLGHAVAWPQSMETPIRLRFDQETEKVLLYLATTGGVQPRISLVDVVGETHPAKVEVVSVGGPYVIVTVGGGRATGIVIHGETPVTLFGSCIQVAVTTGDTREWTCFNVARGPTPVLQAPGGLALAGVPLVAPAAGASPARPSAQHGMPGLGVGVSWAGADSSTAMPTRGAVAYHVYRKPLGNALAQPVMPTDLAGFVRVTEDRSNPTAVVPMPLRPLPSGLAARPAPAGWPQQPLQYIDGPLGERWYAYAISGVDLFGRSSPPVFAVVELRDRLPPPPPTGVSARFIDTAIPVDDPAYDVEAATLSGTMTDGAIAVRWSWPHYRERQASDVREFRIYWQPGRWNVYPGTIDVVTSHGDWSEVSLTLDAGPLPQWMQGGWLRINGEAYRINYTSALRPLRVIVRNRLLRRDADGKGEPPPLGRGTLLVDAGDDGVAPDPNYRDPADIRLWARRVAVVPYAAPPEGQLVSLGTSAITDTVDASRWHRYADGTCTLRLERPFRGDVALLIGATLTVGNVTLRVDSAAGGRVLLIRVSMPAAAPMPASLPTGQAVLAVPGLEAATLDVASGMPSAAALATMCGGAVVTAAGDVLPVLSAWIDGATRLMCCVQRAAGAVASQPCAWYPDYEALIANPGLVLSGDQAQAFGTIAISTADMRDDVPNRRNDDPLRLGNEGEPTAPISVSRARRVAPAAPVMPSTLPTGQTRLQTDEPDYYGRVRYTLSWLASSGASGYYVYRALASAVERIDQQNRRMRVAHYRNVDSFADDPGFAAWFAGRTFPQGVTVSIADLTADPSTFTPEKAAAVDGIWREWGSRFYAAQTDAQRQTLAGRDGNDKAFGRVTAAPVEATTHVDEFEAPGPDSFFYRVASVDAAGNQSALGASTLPVYAPDRVRPAPPVFTRVTGGDRAITLTWQSSQDEGASEYLVYRADSAEAAADVRDMTLVQRIAITAGPVLSRPAEVMWTDGSRQSPTPPASPRWYRLCTRRANGMVSAPSGAMAGVAFDATPAPVVAVNSLQWRSTGPRSFTLAITWTPQPLAEVRVQRRAQGKPEWKAVTGWLPGSTASFDDASAEFWLNQDVRIETRLRAAGAVGPTTSATAALR